VANFDKNKNSLSFIIVNYNLAKEIENCITSLIEKIDYAGQIDYEIIIVDNHSPDDNLPAVEKKFIRDNINFYYLNENTGFGNGCNYGYSKASGKFICFLNPDTIIIENIFSQIIDIFQSDKSVGIIGPRQQTRPPFFDFSAGFYPNIFIELLNLFGIGVFAEGFIVSLYTKLNRYKNMEVDWILGAAIFIRTELFEMINGFDKDYFMFFEEVDLCKRVSNAKFKIIYAPKLKIHHIGSVSGKKDYRLYTIRTYSSKFIYISKHSKVLKKNILKFLLYSQLFSQILIWSVLITMNKQKSKQKLSAFFYLMRNKFKLV